jgi:hypothetical protein
MMPTVRFRCGIVEPADWTGGIVSSQPHIEYFP